MGDEGSLGRSVEEIDDKFGGRWEFFMVNLAESLLEFRILMVFYGGFKNLMVFYWAY